MRPKLDPRFAFLLALPATQLAELKRIEDERFARIGGPPGPSHGDEVSGAKVPDAKSPPAFGSHRANVFAPLTSGIYIPALGSGSTAARGAPTVPYASVFLHSEASTEDLEQFGVVVRSRSGDIVTAFIPLERIARVEELAAVLFIELARPHFPTLEIARQWAEFDSLQAPSAFGPGITGAGVVVGIVDTVLDFYHDDFRKVVGDTRVQSLWDQTLTAVVGEAAPAPASGFPASTAAVGGVEYAKVAIDGELTHPAANPAYQRVRHGGAVDAHGTMVAGAAAGNGRASGGTFRGAAPDADIIFVAYPDLFDTAVLADSTYLADGLAYVFSRAAALGKPCVANVSVSDNQGAHDGTTMGEQFMDNLLLVPGRALVVSAGNSNGLSEHAAGTVAAGGTTPVVLNYLVNANQSDCIEIWYDGSDQFAVTITVPLAPAVVLGPLAAGTSQTYPLAGVGAVAVESRLNDVRNGDNCISIIISLAAGAAIPPGNWTIALTGTVVVDGRFNAWVDRNNRPRARWQAPRVQEGTLTLGVPSTSQRAITVGNHRKVPVGTPAIAPDSGRGPSRDGRSKPEIAAVGSFVVMPKSWNRNGASPSSPYVTGSGTSFSAPLVAGACALLFQCRGATATWANVKQILEDTAVGVGAVPATDFGFGYLDVKNACTVPAPQVDVWLRDDASDTGLEPFTGPVNWLSPDIELLDTAGAPVANPTHDSTQRFSNRVRVTVRNRGSSTARNTEVFLYWADPATNIPYPGAWNASGIFTGAPGFATTSNKLVIAQLASNGSTTVEFAWAPPAPGANLRGDAHYCLLVRLENLADPSQISSGGWSAISARNNIALHNLHVQTIGTGDASSAFEVVGSDDEDGLSVAVELAGGEVELALPVAALPWRDLAFIEKFGRRAPYAGPKGSPDPLDRVELRLEGQLIESRTGVLGGGLLSLQNGIARVVVAQGKSLLIPQLRLAAGARMPVELRVRNPEVDVAHRRVHVAQFSGGQRVGGVTLELRKRGH